MSILNDTLKSLDNRNQSEDFGLPPTVEVSQRSPLLKICIVFVIVLTLSWLFFGFVFDNFVFNNNESDNSAYTNAASPQKAVERLEDKHKQSLTAESENKREGMTSTPLSDQDLAYQATPSDVVDLVFTRIDETVEDDEAEYRAQAKGKPSTEQSNTNTRTADKISAPNSKEAVIAVSNSENERETRESQTPPSIISRQPTVDVAPKSPEEQSALHLEAGLKAYNFGMFDEAQKSFTLALTTSPKNEQARKQLAALYFGQNNNQQALRVLSEGIMLSPENLEWRELMAKILVQENRFEEVINLMPDHLDAKALAEKRADYLILKGTAAQTINKPAQAVSAFSAMTSLQPENAKWWLALGVNYDVLNNANLALSSYSRALAIGGLSTASAQYARSRLNDLKEQP
ncbi:tetratricopeptide repeat protein [Alteromonas sp. IB21]|uniref:tetratricopeptide repeat protein n=1 Tax=Alteromonas sp. IB21 TaxID=2779369 RepID=UPI0018E86D25|nr:tetratricopeptide repeat protein [Alteromonas sp. IB21]MBJ2130716.1 tetratricopeptide repeat protein [Alteromonas sp. IB21]